MAAKIRESLPLIQVSLIAGGGGDFIVKAEEQVLWDKNQQEGLFPDEAPLLARLKAMHVSNAAPIPPRGRYQSQDSDQTLAEGIEEYMSLNPGLTAFKPEDDGAQLFLSHDACHVVFGLGTCVLEEALVDYWTIFGTDLTIRTYLSYAKYISKIDLPQIARTLGYSVFLKETLVSAPYFIKVRRQAKQMARPWSFHGYGSFKETPLSKIRKDHGIKIIRVPEKHRRYSSVSAASSAV